MTYEELKSQLDWMRRKYGRRITAQGAERHRQAGPCPRPSSPSPLTQVDEVAGSE